MREIRTWFFEHEETESHRRSVISSKAFSVGLYLCAFAPLREIFFAVIMASVTDR
jgi:hypothetical protein